MKKTTIIFGTTLLFLSSCMKNYTCECTGTSNFGNSSSTTFTLPAKNKRDAKQACEDQKQQLNTGAISSTVTCELK